jgi:hypothetical protein
MGSSGEADLIVDLTGFRISAAKTGQCDPGGALSHITNLSSESNNVKLIQKIVHASILRTVRF